MTRPQDVADLPLRGKTIVVTRAAEQAPSLTSALASLGAKAITMPTIAIKEPPSDEAIRAAIADIGSYSWVVLTSTNAVDRFFGYLAEAGATTLPSSLRVAVVGASTATVLRERGVEPALVPADYRAEGLIEEFDRLGAPEAGTRVLVPRALSAREILPEHLTELGYEVVIAPVYETVATKRSATDIEDLRAADGITFTSPTTARFLFEGCRAAGADPLALLKNVHIFSIGPVTTAELVELGVDETRISEGQRSTIEDLARAVKRALQSEIEIP